MGKKAVLIGINYVHTHSELAGCVNDCENLKALLKEKYGFVDTEIHILCDSGKDAHKTNSPTYKKILAEIDWLVADAKAGDSLVFTYSGHGSTVPDENDDESDHEDETLCPVDYEKSGFLIDDLIKQRLADKVPEGAQLVGVVDACHSGTIFDLKYSVKPANIKSKYILPHLGHFGQTYLKMLTDEQQDASNEVYIHKKETATKGKVICISGCKDNQTSADTFEGGKHTGALTWALLESLKACNYDIVCCDLIHHIQSMLKKNHYEQVPQMSFGNILHIDEKFSFTI
jgi:hypothetical protein